MKDLWASPLDDYSRPEEDDRESLDVERGWPPQFEEECGPVPAAGLGLDCPLWIDGVRLSPFEGPDCLLEDRFECYGCRFFAPRTCRLRRRPGFLVELRVLFGIYRERRARYFRRRDEQKRALWLELRAHGRPLHYTVLARMVAERYPNLGMTAPWASHIMSSEPTLFEKLAPGVYRCISIESDGR